MLPSGGVGRRPDPCSERQAGDVTPSPGAEPGEGEYPQISTAFTLQRRRKCTNCVLKACGLASTPQEKSKPPQLIHAIDYPDV